MGEELKETCRERLHSEHTYTVLSHACGGLILLRFHQEAGRKCKCIALQVALTRVPVIGCHMGCRESNLDVKEVCVSGVNLGSAL